MAHSRKNIRIMTCTRYTTVPVCIDTLALARAVVVLFLLGLGRTTREPRTIVFFRGVCLRGDGRPFAFVFLSASYGKVKSSEAFVSAQTAISMYANWSYNVSSFLIIS